LGTESFIELEKNLACDLTASSNKREHAWLISWPTGISFFATSLSFLSKHIEAPLSLQRKEATFHSPVKVA
jgi:hypothetical protein